MSETVLQINSVYKNFSTNSGSVFEALENINIDVAENSFTCIVGPSGCGKSTLLRIIAGLDTPSAGSVFYQGSPIVRPTAKIGLVFQEYSLLPWRSTLDNVALGLEFSGINKQDRLKTALNYLKMVGLEEFSRALPHELSGGMRQRVAIARAMAVEPHILLMDEPFGALDAHTRILLQKELLKVWESHRKTVLFVTHSVDEAVFLADRIVIMGKRPGRIKSVADVNIPRPRNRALPAYGELCAGILEILEEQL